MKRDDRTEYVSYNPPRYTYKYKFRYIINVNNPYFDEMKFELNSSNVEIKSSASSSYSSGSTGGVLGDILNIAAGAVTGSGVVVPSNNPEYAKYEQIGADITAALTGAQTIVREEKEAANAAPKIGVCPYCGAQTTVTPDGKCEYCGGYIVDQI